MENELLKIKEEALNKLDECSSLKELNDIRVLYLGKKGPIQEAMKSMKNMDPEARKTAFPHVTEGFLSVLVSYLIAPIPNPGFPERRVSLLPLLSLHTTSPGIQQASLPPC